MKQLDRQLEIVDPKAYRYRRANDRDFETLIDESTQVFIDGKLRIHYELLSGVPGDLLRAFQEIRYNNHWRTEGLLTQSRTFGSMPRVTIRRDFCRTSNLVYDHQQANDILLDYAQKADAAYSAVNPDLHAKARELVAKVKPCWHLRDTVFTSGICNKDNALFYHLDAGNFPDLWSAMYALSLDCGGGNLSMPGLKLGFSFERPALIMFDGQGIMHGVTPLEKRSQQAYRYSVVYYALKQLCNCGTPEEELTRIRQVKTSREVKRTRKPA